MQSRANFLFTAFSSRNAIRGNTRGHTPAWSYRLRYSWKGFGKNQPRSENCAGNIKMRLKACDDLVSLHSIPKSTQSVVSDILQAPFKISQCRRRGIGAKRHAEDDATLT